MAKPELNARVSERIDFGPELAVFRIAPQGWELPDFKPGQFTTLGLLGSAPRSELSDSEEKIPPPDKFIQRAYSIASSPLEKDYLEFYLAHVRHGALTPRLWNLKVGDSLWMSPKMSGHFTMDSVSEDQNLVFISTGTGIAPFVSMLETYLKTHEKRKFALFHGVRQSQDLGYRSELQAMQQLCPRLNYFPIISRPHLDPIPWHGPVGHVQNLWKSSALKDVWGFTPTPENTHIYLCGSPAMIDDMVIQLAAEGFKENKKDEPGTVHVERYW